LKTKKKTSKKKLNEGCLRIFQFLKLLYEDNAYYNNVIGIFKDDLNAQSTNNIQVILNKYINTLKVFGLKVVKKQHKYEIYSSLYSMDFTLEDLKSMSILASSIQNFPDDDMTEDITAILRNIQFRMNSKDKTAYSNIAQTNNYNFTFQYLDMKEQIDQCKKLCKDNQIINIVYKKNKKELRVRCIPKEILYDSKNAYFSIYNIVGRENIEIPLSNILYIETAPLKVNMPDASPSIVFKLKNRLAKTYKLKKDVEQLQEIDSNGYPIILNKGEPEDKLMQRLLRYSFSCEIISPKNVREKFIELINKTLSNYEN